MFAEAFQFDRNRLHRMRDAFGPRKPRNPLVRIAVGVLGLGVLALLIFVSVFVGAAMIVGGLAYRLWSRRARPIAKDPRIVDGECRVLSRPTVQQRR